jgi:uncharacterized membrane protein
VGWGGADLSSGLHHAAVALACMADVEVTHRELVERRAAAERLEARGLQVHRIVGGLVLASENVVQVKSHLQVRNAAGLDKALSFVTYYRSLSSGLGARPRFPFPRTGFVQPGWPMK